MIVRTGMSDLPRGEAGVEAGQPADAEQVDDGEDEHQHDGGDDPGSLSVPLTPCRCGGLYQLFAQEAAETYWIAARTSMGRRPPPVCRRTSRT